MRGGYHILYMYIYIYGRTGDLRTRPMSYINLSIMLAVFRAGPAMFRMVNTYEPLSTYMGTLFWPRNKLLLACCSEIFGEQAPPAPRPMSLPN